MYLFQLTVNAPVNIVQDYWFYLKGFRASAALLLLQR